MLQWLNTMTFSNGDIPMVNDSAPGIAPSTNQLIEYAVRLDIISNQFKEERNQQPITLQDSGYRRFNGLNYECIIDIGTIGADYQPGHAHADTFNFLLYHLHKPVIVETGISTYEKNERRQIERGTHSHNTVQLSSLNSSDVWGGFRVGQRAKVTILKENGNLISARHNGYKHLGFVHERIFEFDDSCITITDKNQNRNLLEAVARIHLYPDIKFQLKGNVLFLEGMRIEFKGHDEVRLSDYMFASHYNKLIPSKVIEIQFNNQLVSKIFFNTLQ
jgi:uncharacterized heparinase superfamily protein